MTQRFSYEGTIGLRPNRDALPARLSAELEVYARAFLRIDRSELRFVWREADTWYEVQLRRTEAIATASPSQPQALLRIQETALPFSITARELDVLTLLALGLTNPGIAQRLGTSARTVSTQVEVLLKKLMRSTRGGLAAFAVDVGLLRLPLPGGAPESADIGIAALELAAHQEHVRFDPPVAMHLRTSSPIRIGLLIPFGSGGDAQQLRNGARLAVDQINARGGVGGRALELVEVEVEMFSWQSVRTGLEQLLGADVAAICTNYVSSEHPEFLESLTGYGRPFLHTATDSAAISQIRADPAAFSMMLQTCASETHYGPGMIRFVTALVDSGRWEPSQRRILSLEQASHSMTVTTPAFIEQARAQGWDVLEPISTPRGATDWDAVIALAHAAQPDVLFVSNFIEDELVAFQQAFVRAPLRSLVYAVYTPSIPSFAERLGSHAHGVVWATTTGTYNDTLGQKFRQEYTTRFGRAPGWSQAGASYDHVHMLASAWQAVDSRQYTEVLRHLRRQPFRGVNGVYYFGIDVYETSLYPDTSGDVALSQAHLVYQLQPTGQTLLAPEPFGTLRNFVAPPWLEPLAGRSDGEPVSP